MQYNVKESGLRIRSLRIQRNLTQENMAAKLMITPRAYGKIERGECGVSVDLLVEITSFFDVTLDYLILGKETRAPFVKQQVHIMAQRLLELEEIL